MPKSRSLSDDEIAIAKAMLRKGWRNDAIHYYFNRADRLISSGRIAQIKTGGCMAHPSKKHPRTTSTRSWLLGKTPKPVHLRNYLPSTRRFFGRCSFASPAIGN
jgi:hypothetical protein